MIILQWAEVLSADAFSAFEDAGLDDKKVCRKKKRGVFKINFDILEKFRCIFKLHLKRNKRI